MTAVIIHSHRKSENKDSLPDKPNIHASTSKLAAVTKIASGKLSQRTGSGLQWVSFDNPGLANIRIGYYKKPLLKEISDTSNRTTQNIKQKYNTLSLC